MLATNKARRARLAAIAEDRLAHQEYVDARDAIDRNIAAMYTKLQKKDGPKASHKKKKQASHHHHSQSKDSPAVTGISALPPCPAALGLSPDERNSLRVPNELNELVRTRRNWVDVVGGVFEKKERECPGRIWGYPKESVFRGVEEEVRAELERGAAPAPPAAAAAPTANGVGHAHTNGRANGVAPRTSFGAKGKGRAGDEMDLG